MLVSHTGDEQTSIIYESRLVVLFCPHSNPNKACYSNLFALLFTCHAEKRNNLKLNSLP